MAGQRIWTGSAWEDVIAVPANMVTTDTSQTLTGQKTFNLAPLVPDSSFGVSKLSATGTRDATTYLRGDGTWATVATGAPANMVTTDTNQTISGTKTFSASPAVPDGSWTIAKTTGLQTSLDSKYSATNAPPAPSNMVTTDTTQTIAGAKTFGSVVTMNPSSPAGATSWSNSIVFSYRSASTTQTESLSVNTIGQLQYTSVNGFRAEGLYDTGARVWSAVSPPASLLVNESAGVPVTPNTGYGVFYALNDSRPYFKNEDGNTFSLVNVEPYIMAVTGTLTVAAGKSRVYLEGNYVVESIRASVNTAPVGASVIVDVNLNGTSIFTTQANRPAIIAGANTGTASLGAGTTTAISTGQYLTVDVDQIGSTTAGADLTVVIRLRRT